MSRTKQGVPTEIVFHEKNMWRELCHSVEKDI